jgi:sialidase-1
MKTRTFFHFTFILLSLFAMSSSVLNAEVALAPLFMDHMVLQRDKQIPISGTATPNATIQVALGDAVREIQSNENGVWEVEFPPQSASLEPSTLTATDLADLTSVTIRDILIGDVWICSGQSNMRWMLHQCETGAEAVATAANPHIRLLRMQESGHPGGSVWDQEMLNRCVPDRYYIVHPWVECSPGSAADFSGVGYFFGKRLHDELNVPIGLIQNAIGGSPTEAWIPEYALFSDPKTRALVNVDWLDPSNINDVWVRDRGRHNLGHWYEQSSSNTEVGPRPGHPFAPSFLFEAGIRPLVSQPVRGVIWYQGESNAENTALHDRLFPQLVNSWRKAWNDNILPFYFVQLAALNRPTWPEFREGQRQLDMRIHSTGMAVTIDIGHPTNVHPTNKRDVGDRLARLALSKEYGREILASGPTIANVQRCGMRIRLTFNNVGDGLDTKDGLWPRGFEIAGTDGLFHPAIATILDNRKSIDVSSPKVEAPVAVRYAWAPYPETNFVINSESLPLGPFLVRTEQAIEGESNTLWSEGFENAEPDLFEILDTSQTSGVWTTVEGEAEISSKYAYTGTQCLHLMGGELTQVEFCNAGATINGGADDKDRTTMDGGVGINHTPSVPFPEETHLAFQAERWTSRSPFSFRIEALRNNAWEEIYNGDQEILVGRPFKSNVSIEFDGRNVERLRLSCVSPPTTGILIDDFRVLRPTPMRITSSAVDQLATPVLTRTPNNSVARLRITTSGSLDPFAVQSLDIGTEGTTSLDDVEKIEIFYSGNDGNPSVWSSTPDNIFASSISFGEGQEPSIDATNSSEPILTESRIKKPVSTLTFTGEQSLLPGDNFFWVSFTLKDDVDLTHRVDASVDRIVLAERHSTDASGIPAAGNGIELIPLTPAPEGTKRIGTAIRMGGEDESGYYRIPGLITTNAGTLIAVYDIRRRRGSDLPGDIDIGASRSTDGGRTWEPMTIPLDMGSDPSFNYDGVGDPAILVDRQTGTIWVAGLWSHGNRAWHGSQPGMTPEETGQFVLARSDDDGRTWSEPINITEQIKDPAWNLLLQGPGRGITMSDGTLIFPAQYKDPEGLPHSTLIFSRDHGETWTIASGVASDTTEAQVVELEDGLLMLNCRDNRGGSRRVATSDDLGATWNEHPSSRSALREPVCMASLINVDRDLLQENQGRLLFCNPNVPSAPRRHITIRASADGGLTWTSGLLVDESTGAGYSCLTMIDENTVGVLYEGSRGRMTFQQVKLEELFRERRSPDQYVD